MDLSNQWHPKPTLKIEAPKELEVVKKIEVVESLPVAQSSVIKMSP